MRRLALYAAELVLACHLSPRDGRRFRGVFGEPAQRPISRPALSPPAQFLPGRGMNIPRAGRRSEAPYAYAALTAQALAGDRAVQSTLQSGKFPEIEIA